MKSINIDTIYGLIKTIKVDTLDKYILTYPTYLDCLDCEKAFSRNSLRMAAGFAYSWMPRVLSLNLSAENTLLDSITNAKQLQINDTGMRQLFDQTVQYTYGSVVASSKILHFIFPDCFPIFDSHIFKACWKVDKVYHYQMTANNYFEYLNEVHRLLEQKGVGKLTDYLINELKYDISKVRAIEMAIFLIQKHGA